MFYAASDLLRYDAVVEGTACPITDFFLSDDLAHLQNVAVRKSRWPWAEQGAVNAQHLGEPDCDSGQVHVSIEEGQLHRAPEVAANTSLEVIAQSIAGERSTLEQTTEKEDFEVNCERVTEWLRAPIFHEGEPIGRLDDFLLEWPRPKVSHVVVNTGIDLPVRQVVLPFEAIETVVPERRSIDMAANQNELATAPEVQTFDGLERRGIDTVRNYYGPLI